MLLLTIITFGCQQKALYPVSVSDFKAFVSATNYITDAEKYGWSIVQKDIVNFEIRENATWRNPDSINMAQDHFAVTQVSYNDALAYAHWAKGHIPTYEIYWQMVQNDTRPINENSPKILPLSQSNIVGNVWELTKPDQYGRIRLAGGSYLCDKSSCNGTSQDRILHIDQITGNTHISFCIIK